MDSHNIVKAPPRGRVLHGGALLVRKGSPLVVEPFANAGLQRGIHEQAHRHHHEECHDPLGLVEIPRRGQKAWGLEETKAPFRMPWPFVPLESLLGWERGVVQFVRGQQDTTVVGNECLMDSDP